MSLAKKKENWSTTVNLGKEGIQFSTENKKLAIGAAVGFFGVLLITFIPGFGETLGKIIRAWAGSAVAIVLLIAAVIFMEANSRGRKKPKVWPFVQAHFVQVLIAIAVLSFLLALTNYDSVGTVPSATPEPVAP